MISCCQDFENHVYREACGYHKDAWECPDAVVVRFAHGAFGLPIRDGGEAVATSAIVIAYCPWCGTHLADMFNWGMGDYADVTDLRGTAVGSAVGVGDDDQSGERETVLRVGDTDTAVDGSDRFDAD